MRYTRLILFLLLTVITRPALSDPRWWTHDRAITSGMDAKTNPDVHIVAGQATAGVAPILVTWEEASNLGITDIYVDASFDGGCTWCGPVLWAGGPEAELRPRIAAGNTPSNRLSIQVVFTRGNEVLVASDASISAFQPAATLCRAFSVLATPTPTVLAMAFGVSAPRITVTSKPPGQLHFHAVWQEDVGPSSRMRYDHDLAGDGSGWGPGVLDLSMAIGEPGFDPDIASDGLSGVSTDTSATVMYRGVGGAIFMSRSTDSGLSWSRPGVRVSGADMQAFPVIDSSTNPFGDAQVWNGGGYRADGAAHNVSFDAAYWTAPLTRMPDFDPGPDLSASIPPDSPGVDVAISLPPASSGAVASASAFLFWARDGAPGEIVSRAGVLSPFTPMPRNLDQYPIAAQRVAPPDPAISLVSPHSNCLWSDDWPALAAGACVPQPRPGGSAATHVQAADATAFGNVTPTVATVFADDRSGVSQVYFKQLDGSVAAPAFSVPGGIAVGCSALREVEAQVTFALVAECATARERVDRYLIYYGSETSEGASADGPFVNRFEVPNVALSNPAIVTIPGLKAGEVYDFAIVAEDEARNLSPQSFDPRAVNTSLVTTQKFSKVVTPRCEPALRVVLCEPGPDDCGGVSDGTYNPGETLPVTMHLSNAGDWAATAVQGSATATGATVLPPATFAIPSIAISATELATVTVRLACPSNPGEPSLSANVTSDAGMVDYGTLSCPVAPLVSVDCGRDCTAVGCFAGSLSLVRDVKGIKNGTGGATFSWLADPDPNVVEYHLNSVVDKVDIPNAHLPALGVGNLECTSLAAATTCDDPDALGPPARIFYQVYSACGPSDVEEGP